MSAPSTLHENRVAQLDTLAVLAGCRSPARLGSGTLPDVARVDRPVRRLFIGDGKATETAGCSETQRRLRRYVKATDPWRRAGFAVRVAVCHGAQSGPWRSQLEVLASRAGAQISGSGMMCLDGTTAVSWVDLVAASTSQCSSSTVVLREHADQQQRPTGR